MARKLISIALIFVFFLDNVSFASEIRPSEHTLSPQSRLKPFFEAQGVGFLDEFSLMYAAGELRDLIDTENARAGNIERLNKRWFPEREIEIEPGIFQGEFSSGKRYNYAVIKLNSYDRHIKAVFAGKHETLTERELSEIGIKTGRDKSHYHGSKGSFLERIWFIDLAREAVLQIDAYEDIRRNIEQGISKAYLDDEIEEIVLETVDKLIEAVKRGYIHSSQKNEIENLFKTLMTRKVPEMRLAMIALKDLAEAAISKKIPKGFMSTSYLLDAVETSKDASGLFHEILMYIFVEKEQLKNKDREKFIAYFNDRIMRELDLFSDLSTSLRALVSGLQESQWEIQEGSAQAIGAISRTGLIDRKILESHPDLLSVFTSFFKQGKEPLYAISAKTIKALMRSGLVEKVMLSELSEYLMTLYEEGKEIRDWEIVQRAKVVEVLAREGVLGKYIFELAPGFVDTLVNAAKSDDSWVSRHSTQAIVELAGAGLADREIFSAHPEIIHNIIEGIRSSDHVDRKASAENIKTLIEAGAVERDIFILSDVLLNEIVSGLKNDDMEMKRSSLRVIEVLIGCRVLEYENIKERSKIVSYFATGVINGDWQHRIFSAGALTIFLSRDLTELDLADLYPEIFENIISGLSHKDWKERISAVNLVTRFVEGGLIGEEFFKEHPAIVEGLIRGIKDNVGWVRECSVEAICAIKEAGLQTENILGSVDYICTYVFAGITSGERDIRISSINSMEMLMKKGLFNKETLAFDPDLLEILILGLRERDGRMRRFSAESLSVMTEEGLIPAPLRVQSVRTMHDLLENGYFYPRTKAFVIKANAAIEGKSSSDHARDLMLIMSEEIASDRDINVIKDTFSVLMYFITELGLDVENIDVEQYATPDIIKELSSFADNVEEGKGRAKIEHLIARMIEYDQRPVDDLAKIFEDDLDEPEDPARAEGAEQRAEREEGRDKEQEVEDDDMPPARGMASGGFISTGKIGMALNFIRKRFFASDKTVEREEVSTEPAIDESGRNIPKFRDNLNLAEKTQKVAIEALNNFMEAGESGAIDLDEEKLDRLFTVIAERNIPEMNRAYRGLSLVAEELKIGNIPKNIVTLDMIIEIVKNAEDISNLFFRVIIQMATLLESEEYDLATEGEKESLNNTLVKGLKYFVDIEESIKGLLSDLKDEKGIIRKYSAEAISALMEVGLITAETFKTHPLPLEELFAGLKNEASENHKYSAEAIKTLAQEGLITDEPLKTHPLPLGDLIVSLEYEFGNERKYSAETIKELVEASLITAELIKTYPRFLQSLIVCLHDREGSIREFSFFTIKTLAETGIISKKELKAYMLPLEELIAGLKDESGDIRTASAAAMKLLMQAGLVAEESLRVHSELLEELIAGLKDESGYIRIASAEAMKLLMQAGLVPEETLKSHPAPLKELIAVLKDEKSGQDIRVASAEALRVLLEAGLVPEEIFEKHVMTIEELFLGLKYDEAIYSAGAIKVLLETGLITKKISETHKLLFPEIIAGLGDKYGNIHAISSKNIKTLVEANIVSEKTLKTCPLLLKTIGEGLKKEHGYARWRASDAIEALSEAGVITEEIKKLCLLPYKELVADLKGKEEDRPGAAAVIKKLVKMGLITEEMLQANPLPYKELVESLKDKDHVVSWNTVAAITDLVEAALITEETLKAYPMLLEQIAEGLNSETSYMREHSVEALKVLVEAGLVTGEKLGARTVLLENAIAGLKDEDGYMREYSLEAINVLAEGGLITTETLETHPLFYWKLAKGLEDGSSGMRVSSAKTIKVIIQENLLTEGILKTHPLLLEGLIKGVKDENGDVRKSSAETIKELARKGFLPTKIGYDGVEKLYDIKSAPFFARDLKTKIIKAHAVMSDQASLQYVKDLMFLIEEETQTGKDPAVLKEIFSVLMYFITDLGLDVENIDVEQYATLELVEHITTLAEDVEDGKGRAGIEHLIARMLEYDQRIIMDDDEGIVDDGYDIVDGTDTIERAGSIEHRAVGTERRAEGEAGRDKDQEDEDDDLPPVRGMAGLSLGHDDAIRSHRLDTFETLTAIHTEALTYDDPEAIARESLEINGDNIKSVQIVPQKTIIFHVIVDDILPPGQRNLLRELEQSMRNEKYLEKLVALSLDGSKDAETFMMKLAELKNRLKRQYDGYDLDINIACHSAELVTKLQEKGIKALAFEREGEGEVVQIEGIMLALRALRSGSIEKLLRAYKRITGKPAKRHISDIEALARALVFVLPARKVDLREAAELNRLMRENILNAA